VSNVEKQQMTRVFSAILGAAIFFALGVFTGHHFIVAPSDGPQGFLDPSNIEILLICGLIPAFIGAGLGALLPQLFRRSRDFDD